MKFFGLPLLLPLLCLACSQRPVPKPVGYARIPIDSAQYIKLTPTELPFSFRYDSSAELFVPPKKKGYASVLLSYPLLNASILCSHARFTPEQFQELSQESYKLIFQHNVVASEIVEHPISQPENQLFGTLYHLKGKVATPFQAELTDSVKNFFRITATLNCEINTDSLAPVYDRLHDDLNEIIRTLQFKP